MLNSFESEFFLKEPEQKSSSAKRNSGLWNIPSYFNHSCVPNTVRFFFGDTMLIYARTNISKDEEITTSYFSNQLEYKDRQDLSAEFYNFNCSCKLCELEDKEPKKIAKLRQGLLKKLVINVIFTCTVASLIASVRKKFGLFMNILFNSIKTEKSKVQIFNLSPLIKYIYSEILFNRLLT